VEGRYFDGVGIGDGWFNVWVLEAPEGGLMMN